MGEISTNSDVFCQFIFGSVPEELQKLIMLRIRVTLVSASLMSTSNHILIRQELGK